MNVLPEKPDDLPLSSHVRKTITAMPVFRIRTKELAEKQSVLCYFARVPEATNLDSSQN